VAMGSADCSVSLLEVGLLRRNSPAWKVYEFLKDGKPRMRHEIKMATGLSGTHVSNILKFLWRRGMVLRSEGRICFDRVVEKRGVGKAWSRFRGHLWIRSDSPLLGANKIVEYEFKKTERYSLEDVKMRKVIKFVEYVEERKKMVVTQQRILEVLKASDVALTSQEIAKRCNANPKRVSTLLNKMYRNGLVIRRGYITRDGREVMFRGRINGYLYALPGTDQIKKRLARGDHLHPWARALYYEIIKYSRARRWVQAHNLAESLGRRPYEIVRMATKLQSTITSIRIYRSSKSTWLYDARFFTEEEIRQWIKKAEEIDSETGKVGQKIGILHEKYCHAALERIWEKVSCESSFKQIIRNGKICHNIRLSNRKEIDRILMVKTVVGNETLLEFEILFEFKYKKGGADARDIKEFLDKLATSHEYGYQEDGRRGMKSNIVPVLVAPSFTKDAIRYARKHGVILLHTWKLSRMLKNELGINAEFKRIVKILLKMDEKSWDKELKKILRPPHKPRVVVQPNSYAKYEADI